MESPAPESELGSPTSPSDPPPPPDEPLSSMLQALAVVGIAVVIVSVIVLVVWSVMVLFSESLTIVVAVEIVAVIVLVGVCFYIKKKRRLALRNLPFFAPENDLSTGPPESGQQNVPPPTANNRPVTTEDTASPRIAANSSVPPLSRHNTIRDLTSIFTYKELKMATDNFSDANFLGKGGFGKVYKGFLPNGTVVAIKQLQTGSKQGEREFKAEVDTISRVHHRHLVSLVGYCMSEEHRLLVYEFVPNKTLQFHLHEQGRPVMSWRNRMKIALGSARGLVYLHEDCRPRIIHRDIKAANILLDESFEAKVADFGLAKFFADTETHVSTRIMGTPDYIDPEYECFGRLTEKSDIFSFGVMLLELITGRRPIHENKMLVHWARPLLSQALKDGNFIPFVEPNLEYDYSEMKRIVVCAAACVRISDKDRPPMIQIARVLEGIIPLENLDEGVIPGQRRAYSYRNSECGSSEFKDDMENIFNNMVRESGEHGSRSCMTAGDQNLSGPGTEVVESGKHGSSAFITAGDQTLSGPNTEVLESEKHGSSACISCCR